ncbi:Protocadherin-1 [Anopheles sinensis]|uniref:Protocadherin-1 n=1 Tax=Anopheles sinensis TaxID=74873 RepID=A0A084VIK0_ANOSI|nr:Protocadherin-1 [Anopheles sinensis]
MSEDMFPPPTRTPPPQEKRDRSYESVDTWQENKQEHHLPDERSFRTFKAGREIGEKGEKPSFSIRDPPAACRVDDCVFKGDYRMEAASWLQPLAAILHGNPAKRERESGSPGT